MTTLPERLVAIKETEGTDRSGLGVSENYIIIINIIRYWIPEPSELVVGEGDMFVLPIFQDIKVYVHHKCSYDV